MKELRRKLGEGEVTMKTVVRQGIYGRELVNKPRHQKHFEKELTISDNLARAGSNV